MSLRDEVSDLLRQLIRLDTVNPPGNETRAAELLAGYFRGHGIGSELYARSPERANIVARIPGGDGPSLLFLSHMDTVLADAAEWERDPWSGDLVDGEIWGRGALDMKGQVAANAVAFASLAREGFRPPGDLVFCATADEEEGHPEGGYGLDWLCATHPDVIRTDYALNEGGGERVTLGGKVFYLCSTAEKMTAPFRLDVHGRSGHASMPGIADNALVKAARLIQALGEYVPERRLGPEVAGFLRAVLGEAPGADEALERARALDPVAAELVEPLLSATFAPTIVTASQKRNVIPALCSVVVDCRLLPDQLPADVEPVLRGLLGEGHYELTWIEARGGTRSSAETPLWDAIASFVEQAEPGAGVAPTMCAGFTDSHWLREAFGTVAYGFFPARAMDPELAARLIHSANERVPVADLELGVEFLRHAARSLV